MCDWPGRPGGLNGRLCQRRILRGCAGRFLRNAAFHVSDSPKRSYGQFLTLSILHFLPYFAFCTFPSPAE